MTEIMHIILKNPYKSYYWLNMINRTPSTSSMLSLPYRSIVLSPHQLIVASCCHCIVATIASASSHCSTSHEMVPPQTHHSQMVSTSLNAQKWELLVDVGPTCFSSTGYQVMAYLTLTHVTGNRVPSGCKALPTGNPGPGGAHVT